ncbi:MAG: holin family protein [Pseudomonadota bacterium]
MGLNAGLIGGFLNLIFGNDRNAIVETVEVFRPNAEGQAVRDARHAEAALAQYAHEFMVPRRGVFDRVIDGLNRIPRPALALGTLGLFVSAMVDPIWFAERMQGIALVPEPLWWLLGAVVSFYFGARHQAKSQDFQRSIASTLALAPQVTHGISALRALDAGAGDAGAADAGAGDAGAGDAGLGAPEERRDAPQRANAALEDWRATDGRA